MKKTLIVALSILFVVSSVVPVIAADISIGGDAYVEGVWLKDYDLDSRDEEPTSMEKMMGQTDPMTDDRYWTQRVRIKLDAKVGGGVELRTRTVLAEGMWGKMGVMTMKMEGMPMTMSMSDTGDSISDNPVTFDYAYLHIPINDITLDIGRQKVSFGNGFFLKDDTRDRLKITNKVGDTMVVGFADKMMEMRGVAGDDNLDDVDMYGLAVMTMLMDEKFGHIMTGVLGAHRADDTPTNQDGLVVDAFVQNSVAGFETKAEFAIKTGDYFETTKLDTTDKHNQWGGFVSVSKDMDMGLTIGGLVALTGNGYTADKHFTPTVFLGTDQSTGIMDVGQCYNNFENQDEDGNLMVINVSTCDTLLTALSANYKVSGDLAVAARGAYISFSEYGAAGVKGSATEFDAGLEYKLAKNTTYNIDFGYLMPDFDNLAKNDNAMALAHKVEITF